MRRKRFSSTQIIKILKEAELASTAGYSRISWEKLLPPKAKSSAVDYVIFRFRLSERKECNIVSLHRSTHQYKMEPRTHRLLREPIREFANQCKVWKPPIRCTPETKKVSDQSQANGANIQGRGTEVITTETIQNEARLSNAYPNTACLENQMKCRQWTLPLMLVQTEKTTGQSLIPAHQRVL